MSAPDYQVPGDGLLAGAAQGPTEIFWAELRQGRLVLQRCSSCSRVFHRPRLLCPACTSRDWAWEQSAGEGVVYAATTVTRPVGAFRGEEPYTVVLVDLPEGARVTGRMAAVPGASDAVAIGDRVRFALGADHEGGPRVEFEPVR